MSAAMTPGKNRSRGLWCHAGSRGSRRWAGPVYSESPVCEPIAPAARLGRNAARRAGRSDANSTTFDRLKHVPHLSEGVVRVVATGWPYSLQSALADDYLRPAAPEPGLPGNAVPCTGFENPAKGHACRGGRQWSKRVEQVS